jgi:hypothetical protein
MIVYNASPTRHFCFPTVLAADSSCSDTALWASFASGLINFSRKKFANEDVLVAVEILENQFSPLL